MDASKETDLEVNGEVLKGMLVGVWLPVHRRESCKELIQPANVAKLNCLMANVTNEIGAFE